MDPYQLRHFWLAWSNYQQHSPNAFFHKIIIVLKNITFDPLKHSYIILIVAISLGESIEWQGLNTYFSVCLSSSIFLRGMLQPFNIRNWLEALCTLLCGSIIKRKDLTTFILHFLGWISPEQRIKCLAQGHDVVPPVRLKYANPR